MTDVMTTPPADTATKSSSTALLNLEFYWEEAQRIQQEAPFKADTTETEDYEKDDQSDEAIIEKMLPGSSSASPNPSISNNRSSSCMTLAEAATVMRSVGVLNGIARRQREQARNASLPPLTAVSDDEGAAEPEVVAPLKVACDCAGHYVDAADPHPGDPCDNDYLVLERGDDTNTDDSRPLPVYRLRYQSTGVTYMNDLSPKDCDKIRHIAHLELTALFERYNLPFRMGRPPKRRPPSSESKVLGVPLPALLERDRARHPDAKSPIFVEEICHFLDRHALQDEGILRIPGNTARLKRLREELEAGYDNGQFLWTGRRTNDAATLLKQFLRELPTPLLTHDYLQLFAMTEAIDNRRDQLGALNLLVLLLPDVHRETLAVLLTQMRRITEHAAINKMGLSNVAMIIAPNLFCQLGKMSRNADNEVKLAAGTSLVVRIMIYYCRLLFVVPNVLINQLRDLNEAEAGQTKKAKNVKAVKKVLASQKKHSISSPRAIELPSPVVGQVSKNNHYVIKILSPEFPRISMILEISNDSRVCQVLANFRRKQLGLMSPGTSKCTSKESANIAQALDLCVSRCTITSNTSGGSVSPPAMRDSVQPLQAKHYSLPMQDLAASRRYSTPVGPHDTSTACNEDLFECEGNIDSRRLRGGALVMEILKENPSTKFFVRKRQQA